MRPWEGPVGLPLGPGGTRLGSVGVGVARCAGPELSNGSHVAVDRTRVCKASGRQCGAQAGLGCGAGLDGLTEHLRASSPLRQEAAGGRVCRVCAAAPRPPEPAPRQRRDSG